MSKTKDKLEDFDDSAYDTLKEENKYKKIADFHLGQMKVIQDTFDFHKFRESSRPEHLRPEGNWFDER